MCRQSASFLGLIIMQTTNTNHKLLLFSITIHFKRHLNKVSKCIFHPLQPKWRSCQITGDTNNWRIDYQDSSVFYWCKTCMDTNCPYNHLLNFHRFLSRSNTSSTSWYTFAHKQPYCVIYIKAKNALSVNCRYEN